MNEYKVISITLMPQGYCLVKIALDILEENILVIQIEEGIISDIKNSKHLDNDIKEYLVEIILKDNSLLLDRLVQKALNDNTVQKQLKQRQNGVFLVDYDVWIRCKNDVKEKKEKERLMRIDDILLHNSLKMKKL